ncbi:dTDP-4-amino-4,6-dideoxygalactose transaminase [Ochrobactrum sp. RH1CCR137]|nr:MULTISPECIES: DegT/DnrJ/EryC1/StrS family aminotransferase [unclassified Ochrobactrum]MBA8845677.1 dTDP-4-amino-4,6-dideoxygalactose transaminase [Ochrobactrum sp. RH1CCR137]MBA8857399.1 dTDP-4-amino-4,6-dideoxygalactose transaminase [Ochrobactrum sp. RH1CCR134]
MVPNVDDYIKTLLPSLEARRLTNGGALSSELEMRLSELFLTRHVSLVSNGTIAIELAAKAVGLRKKVITTPFTFAATVGALLWIGLDPVLVDIDDEYLTIDPHRVQEAIDEDVSGILGVHVYGCPCDVDELENISNKFKIPVIYDGAHVFDGMYNGKPLVGYGKATTLSFHATKQFNTGEGGAIVTSDPLVDEQVRLFKNFGIQSEDTITAIGTNGKMSELNAAFGLANLSILFEERQRRAAVNSIYLNELEGHSKIKVVPMRPGMMGSNHYFAVRLPVENGYPLRDRAYMYLRERGIFSRKYFSPLISNVPAYTQHMSQKCFDLPNANRAAQEVLVLPLHGGISDEHAYIIARELKNSLA